jgi:hypothetical protein
VSTKIVLILTVQGILVSILLLTCQISHLTLAHGRPILFSLSFGPTPLPLSIDVTRIILDTVLIGRNRFTIPYPFLFKKHLFAARLDLDRAARSMYILDAVRRVTLL